MSLKKYDTVINGFKTTLLLSDEDAKRAGFKPSDGRDRFEDSVASDVSPRVSEAEKTSLRDQHLAEAAEQEKAEQDRLAAEKVETDRIAAEKAAADKAEAERLEAEQAAAAAAEKAKTPANKARTPRGKNA